MRKKVLLVISLLLVIGLTACSFGQQGLKQYSDMSPKEKASFFMKVYISQFDNYQEQSLRTDLTEPQTEMLEKKRDLLRTMWPLINAYNTLVIANGIPSPQSEQEILMIIDELVKIVI